MSVIRVSVDVPTASVAAQSRVPGVALSGIVRDTTGLVLPGATVELRPAEPTLTRSTVSAADGTFEFSDVTVGPYRLLVRFPDSNRSIGRSGSMRTRPGRWSLFWGCRACGSRSRSRATGVDLPPIATMQTEVSRRVIDTLPSESVSAGLSSLVTLTTPRASRPTPMAASIRWATMPTRHSASTTSRSPTSRAARSRINCRRTRSNRSTC